MQGCNPTVSCENDETSGGVLTPLTKNISGASNLAEILKPAFISTTASNKCFYILSTESSEVDRLKEALNFNVYDFDKYEVIIV